MILISYLRTFFAQKKIKVNDTVLCFVFETHQIYIEHHTNIKRRLSRKNLLANTLGDLFCKMLDFFRILTF
jgi:hypothetical protein